MKRIIILISFLQFSAFINLSAQNSTVSNSIYKSDYSLKNLKSINKGINSVSSSGAKVGFNTGVASIEGSVGFAIGAFAELGTGSFSFIPQANYWTASQQNNFELAGLARFYLAKTPAIPYLDGGLGINFFNQESSNVTKLSIDVGGGVEMTNVGTSFGLLFDGKYKLIIRDQGNVSCFIFTVGMNFPLK